jgi:phage baseplate assembly protein gpV
MHMEQIKGLVRLEVERVMARRKHNRNAVVTSVDPDTYSAKVRYEPHDPNDQDNAEGGWIPIQAVANGKGFGIYSLPKVGQPVEVAFDMGDHETGRIVQRHSSEQNQPPQNMKEGEHWFVHETGSAIKFAQDGTVSILGAGSIPNRQGKDATTGKDGTSQQNQQPQGKQTFTVSPDGSFSFAHKGGTTITVDKNGAVTIKAKDQAVTVDAGSGSITYKGSSHSFQGAVSADGAISAQGNISSSSQISALSMLAGGKSVLTTP